MSIIKILSAILFIVIPGFDLRDNLQRHPFLSCLSIAVGATLLVASLRSWYFDSATPREILARNTAELAKTSQELSTLRQSLEVAWANEKAALLEEGKGPGKATVIPSAPPSPRDNDLHQRPLVKIALKARESAPSEADQIEPSATKPESSDGLGPEQKSWPDTARNDPTKVADRPNLPINAETAIPHGQATDQPIVSGDWRGVATSGSRTFDYRWAISQDGEDIRGTIEISRSGVSAAYRFTGSLRGNQLEFKGTSFVRSGGSFCMASGVLSLTGRDELVGHWGPLSSVRGGCPRGSSGEIELSRISQR